MSSGASDISCAGVKVILEGCPESLSTRSGIWFLSEKKTTNDLKKSAFPRLHAEVGTLQDVTDSRRRGRRPTEAGGLLIR